MTTTPELEGAVAEVERLIDNLMQCLGWHDRGKAYASLVGTLHALRDCLPREEAVYLGSQLPTLLRGLYYDAWHLGVRRSAKTRGEFLERIHEASHRDPGVDTEEVAHAVLGLLALRLPPGELEDVKAATPKELRSLWPN